MMAGMSPVLVEKIVNYELAPARNDFHRELLECLACCFTADVPELATDVKALGKCQNDEPRCCD